MYILLMTVRLGAVLNARYGRGVCCGGWKRAHTRYDLEILGYFVYTVWNASPWFEPQK